VGKDDYMPPYIAEEWDQIDMHGYPVYKSVVKVQDDLQEEKLRSQHPELREAYENYAKLLAKYGFWDKIIG
jgi:hypothetical protein